MLSIGEDNSNSENSAPAQEEEHDLQALDLLDVLSGCIESQEDAQELAAGLTEMEDELKAMSGPASFLHFPSKTAVKSACGRVCVLRQCNASRL